MAILNLALECQEVDLTNSGRLFDSQDRYSSSVTRAGQPINGTNSEDSMMQSILILITHLSQGESLLRTR